MLFWGASVKWFKSYKNGSVLKKKKNSEFETQSNLRASLLYVDMGLKYWKTDRSPLLLFFVSKNNSTDCPGVFSLYLLPCNFYCMLIKNNCVKTCCVLVSAFLYKELPLTLMFLYSVGQACTRDIWTSTITQPRWEKKCFVHSV